MTAYILTYNKDGTQARADGPFVLGELSPGALKLNQRIVTAEHEMFAWCQRFVEATGNPKPERQPVTQTPNRNATPTETWFRISEREFRRWHIKGTPANADPYKFSTWYVVPNRETLTKLKAEGYGARQAGKLCAVLSVCETQKSMRFFDEAYGLRTRLPK